MKQRPNVIETLLRCLKLRCPACGKASIMQRPFHIKDHCSNCKVIFKREEGFFVGAILANIIVTEFVILMLYVLSLMVIGSYEDFTLALLFIVAVTFPIAFYHHSWSFWLGFDHLVERLPRGT